MIGDKQLAEWRRLAEAATPGPWERRRNRHPNTNGTSWGWVEGTGFTWDCSHVAGAERDAAFISAARTAVPALLDEVERLRVSARFLGDEANRLKAERDEARAAAAWQGACTTATLESQDRLAAEILELQARAERAEAELARAVPLPEFNEQLTCWMANARREGAKAERARVVAWLRLAAPESHWNAGVADDIERGDHEEHDRST